MLSIVGIYLGYLVECGRQICWVTDGWIWGSRRDIHCVRSGTFLPCLTEENLMPRWEDGALCSEKMRWIDWCLFPPLGLGLPCGLGRDYGVGYSRVDR